MSEMENRMKYTVKYNVSQQDFLGQLKIFFVFFYFCFAFLLVYFVIEVLLFFVDV